MKTFWLVWNLLWMGLAVIAIVWYATAFLTVFHLILSAGLFLMLFKVWVR